MSPPAGYSGTPLEKKLGLKPGQRAHVAGAPAGFLEELALPEGLEVVGARARSLDFALLFVRRRADLTRRLAPLAKRLAPDGMLWLAWPKKASGVPTNLDFDAVQGAGLALTLVDVKVCAIDETWSGLKFVVRKSARGTWPPG